MNHHKFISLWICLCLLLTLAPVQATSLPVSPAASLLATSRSYANGPLIPPDAGLGAGSVDNSSATTTFTVLPGDFVSGALVETVTIAITFSKVGSSSGPGMCPGPGGDDDWAEEVRFRLFAPTGATVTLVNNDYRFSNPDVGQVTVTFDDAAATPVTGLPIQNGTFRPSLGSLADFSGLDPAANGGVWALELTDNAAGDPLCFASATLHITVQEPFDLSITKTDAPDPVVAGELLTYQISVYNAGPGIASGVIVTDTLPGALDYISDTGGCVRNGAVLACPLGGIAAGSTQTFQILTRVPADAVAATPDGLATLHNTVIVTTTGLPLDLNPANNTSSAATFVTELADLRALKVSVPPITVEAGEIFTYTIFVDNFGPSFARSVVFTDTLLSSGTFTLLGIVEDASRMDTCTPSGALIVCTLTDPLETASIAPGYGRWQVQIRARADEAQTIQNTVVVRAATPDPDLSNNEISTFLEITGAADLAVSKNPIAPVVAGQTTTLHTTVSNAGPSTAHHVVLVEHVPAGLTVLGVTHPGLTCSQAGDTLTCAAGSLAPGASRALTVSVAVDPALPAGALVSSASVSGADFDPDNTNNYASTAVNITSAAILSVSKTSTPGTVAAGEPLAYTIVITNAGPSTAQSVALVDTLPTEIVALSATGPAGSVCHLLAGPVACDLGALAPGTTAQVVIQARANAAAASGGVTNQVSVSAANAPTVPAQATTTLYQESDLSVSKTGTGVAFAGDLVRYTLTAANAGPSVATGVVVTDTLPAALLYQTATGGCTETGGVLVCPLGALAVGASRTFDIYARVRPEALPDTTVVNTAVIASPASDPDLSNNTATAATLIQGLADLRVLKVSQPELTVGAGEIFTYTIFVDNFGPSFARSVVFTDTLLAGPLTLLQVLPDPARADSCAVGALIVCTLTDPLETASTPPGYGRWQVQIRARADEAQTIQNTVVVRAATPDPELSNNAATDFLEITAAADLAVVKGAVAPVVAGQTTTLHTTLSNAGPSTAHHVVLVEHVPAGLTVLGLTHPGLTCNQAGDTLTCATGSLAPGASRALTVSVAVDPALPAGALVSSASVSGADLDPDNTNNYASTAVHVTSAAVLAVSKTSTPGTIAAGEPLAYTIVITNAGPSTAQSVALVDTLPAAIAALSAVGPAGSVCHLLAGQVTCDLGALAPGTPVQVVIQARATAAAVSGGVTNQVSVSAANAPIVQAQATTTLYQESDLSVSKTGTGVAYAGDLVYYTLTAANAGPSVATGVVVTDTLPAALLYQTAPGGCTETGGVLVCALGPLAVGASRTLEVYARVRPEALPDTTAINTAVIASPASDPDLSNNTATAATLIQGLADLRVFKVSQPELTVGAGEIFTYTIFVDNFGPSFARSVVFTDTLLSSGTFTLLGIVEDASRMDTCTPSGTLIVCMLTEPLETASIAPGYGRWQVQVRARADEAQTIQNTVVVRAATPDPDLSNNEISTFLEITGAADLAVSKNPVAPVVAGQTTTLHTTVSNAGPSTAHHVVLVEHVPAGLTVLGLTHPGLTCSQAGDTLTCAAGSLAPGASRALTVSVAVDPALPAGALVSSASVSGADFDPDLTNNYASTPVHVTSAATLSVIKTSTPGTVAAGESLIYTIVMTNAGPSTAQSVALVDTLPAEIVALSATGPAGSVCHLLAGPVACDLGALAPGTTAQVVIQARVNAAAASGPVTNQVSVSAANAPTVPAQATTTLYQESDLSVSKTGTGVAFAGDLVRYTLTAANAGPSVASSVVLTDTLPAALEYQTATGGCTETGSVLVCPLGALAVGASRTFDIYAQVRPEALPDTTVVNTAVIASPASDPDLSNNTATAATLIQGLADLRVAKYGLPGGTVYAGERLTYTVIVDNLGPGYARAVTLDDTLTSNGVFELLAVTSDRSAACAPVGATFDKLLALHCTLDNPLEPQGGGAGRWQLTVIVRAMAAQTLNNVARVSGAEFDPNLSNNEAAVQHTISDVADLSISKTMLGQVQVDGQPGGVFMLLPDRVTTGGLLTYTLSVMNAGPSTARNVVLQDRLPGWLTVRALTVSQGVCTTGVPGDPAAPVTCGLGVLSAGQTATLVIAAQLGVDAPGGMTLDNNALVYSDVYDPNNVDNYITQRTTVDAWADLAINKTAAPELALPGQALTYTLVVQNTGPGDAVGAQVEDSVPAGLLDVIWTCTATGGATCTPQGQGYLADTVNLPVNGVLVYTLRGTVGSAQPLTNTAIVRAPVGVGDPYLLNNSATVVNRSVVVYLPLVMRGTQSAVAPDLVVEELIVGRYGVQVVLRNQGEVPVTHGFWVDVYINPQLAPRAVNQVWAEVGTQGMVWGVNASALPLEPGATLLLSVGDDYYWPSLSRVTWPLPNGAQVYAHVDSYAPDTTYGLVLENHEVSGGSYNNILGPVFVPATLMQLIVAPTVKFAPPLLPTRPELQR